MNECRPDPSFDPASVQHMLNKWVIGAVAGTAETIEKALAEYRFNDAAAAIYQFSWGTFCDWYLEFTKPILQENGHPFADETRKTTAWVLDQILLLLNPFMPYITEYLYEELAERTEDKLLMEKAGRLMVII